MVHIAFDTGKKLEIRSKQLLFPVKTDITKSTTLTITHRYTQIHIHAYRVISNTQP